MRRNWKHRGKTGATKASTSKATSITTVGARPPDDVQTNINPLFARSNDPGASASGVFRERRGNNFRKQPGEIAILWILLNVNIIKNELSFKRTDFPIDLTQE
jgi:hypothetical protein